MHCGEELGPVPGLRRALTEAGLSSYVAATEAWCRDAGAAFLTEVQEEIDTICSELRLEQPQRQQFYQAIAAPVVDDVPEGNASTCRWLASAAASTKRAKAGEQRPNYLPALLRSDSLSSVGSGRYCLQQCMPGLKTAFHNAQLAAYVVRAEAWCQQEGAAFLSEVLDDLDELAASLGLANQERERLGVALQRHLFGEAKIADDMIFKQPPETQKALENTSVHELHRVLSSSAAVERC